MDLITISAIVTIVVGLIALINFFFGQKGIIERWQEKRQNHKEEDLFSSTKVVYQENQVQTTESGMMFALVKEHDSPGLTLTTKPIPTIQPNEVLVKVEAASICGSDLHIYHWRESIENRIQIPRIPGHEFCGYVVKCGGNVSGIDVGDLVAAESHVSCGRCTYCQSGNSNVCPNMEAIGFERDGGFAEYVAVPAVNVWKLPKETPLEVATLLEPFGNAVHAAMSQDLVGRTVLITGAGSIGLMVIAVCKWAGANCIISTDLREFRLKLAQKTGADFTFNATRKNQSLEKLIMESTNGLGIDVFLEMSGSQEALELGLKVLRNAGRAVLMGIYRDKATIDLNNLVTYKGITIYGAYGRLPDQTQENMRKLVASGEINIKSLVTHSYRLDEADNAFLAAESGNVGKVLLYPTVKKDLVLPLEFKPSSIKSELPTMYEQSPIRQQANRIIATGNEKKLDDLKKELADLYSYADKLRRIISASRNSLLSATDKNSKNDLTREIAEYEEARSGILEKCSKVEGQIQLILKALKTNQE
jgi:threonine 3-dehydrogenase